VETTCTCVDFYFDVCVPEASIVTDHTMHFVDSELILKHGIL